MFPIRDTVPHARVPVVTILLIAANVAVFLFETTLTPEELERLIVLNGVVPRRYLDPAWARALHVSGLDPWPFLTSMFLHGGWFHLLANVWTLWIFGDNVEDRLGPLRYLAFYLAVGLFAGLLHLASNPHSALPTIGASGAIAGVMGAYLILFPRAQVLTLVPILFYPLFVEVPAVLYLGFWFAYQVLSGTSTVGATEAGGVAWWAHIGGFAAGCALILAAKGRRPRRRAPAGWGLLLLALLLAGCDRDPSAWRRELSSEDRHAAFLAGVAIALEHPRQAGPALRPILRYADDELAWNRAGVRAALASVERRRPELLLEYLVLKGRDRPAVLGALLPAFDRADPARQRATLELVRAHGWEEPEELRSRLVELARSMPEWVAALEAELAGGAADADQLGRFLDDVRSPH